MILDSEEMFMHNAQDHQFRHGENDLFQGKTMRDAKSMFMSALSDSNQIGNCKTSKNENEQLKDFEEMEIDVPESYDWRQNFT